MSDLKPSPNNYGPSSRNFDNDFSLAPFEVIDMGESKVAINFGNMVGYTFNGTVKPQKLLNTKPDPAQYLTVAVGDFVCIVKSGSSATIEKKSPEESTGESVFALAEIKSQETSGDTIYLEIRQIWTGNIDGGGIASTIPFKLTASMIDGAANYTIGKGSITDGTNGTAFNLNGVIETAFPATEEGYVVIEATVTPADLTIATAEGTWAAIIVTDAAEASKEVILTGDPLEQTKIRFCVGKITLSGDPETVGPEDDPLTATVWQGLTSSVRVTYGLMNGLACKVIDYAPTHASKI